jgi:hypothetical protein
MDKKTQILTKSSNNISGYLPLDKSNLQNYSKVVSKFDCTYKNERATAVETVDNINIKHPFGRQDYDFFRPNEAIPKYFRDIVRSCRNAYLRVGIIRNVIDMMTDFACEDLRIIHPDKKIETFYKVWMKKVKIKEAADEFARHLLVDGNVVVKRITAKLNIPIEKQWTDKVISKPDYTVKKIPSDVSPREIPWRYVFLNVYAMKWVGGDAARLSDNKKLVFTLSPELCRIVRSPSGPDELSYIDTMPADIVDYIKKSQTNQIPIDMSKIYIGHHKKDSWEDWAPPFLTSVLPDIYFKDKLRLAETAALDGVINVIRLWKLGDHKEGVLPDEGAVQRLIGILEANTGGGAMDIVWDSMIEMIPHYPPVDAILGSEKYQQVNKDILIGLGVPEVLIGGSGGNFSNSWIQLKTLVEKLKFVRRVLQDWIEEEIKIVAEGMNFDSLPKIRFNEMNLQDENTTKKLIVGLLDRGIISAESVLNVYGEDFLFEVEKIKRESAIFKKSDIKVRTPLGPTVDEQMEMSKQQIKLENQFAPKPQTPAGRPSGTPDDSSRETRTPKVRTTASIEEMICFALEAIESINDNIIPIYMENIGVTNARKLTSEQKDELNKVRAHILGSIKFGDDISYDGIINISENISSTNSGIIKEIDAQISEFASKNGALPNLLQRKKIEALSWFKIQS